MRARVTGRGKPTWARGGLGAVQQARKWSAGTAGSSVGRRPAAGPWPAGSASAAWPATGWSLASARPAG